MPTAPIFPLNTVIYPGVVVPLHIFEDRYRALVRDLLAQEDPVERVFGVVAIREGYEVGDHGVQSVYRTGTLVQLGEHQRYEDGRFDIVVTGRQRFRLDEMHTGGEYLRGELTVLVGTEGSATTDPVEDDRAAARALSAFTRYRVELAALRGDDLLPAHLPQDAEYLSYTLAASSVLPLPVRQSLLEAPSSAERLDLVADHLGAEVRAMTALPSLPATELARTRWSPN